AAEVRRERIGDRTRGAPQVLKGRGVPVGGSRPECRNLTPAARRKGSEASARASRARAIEEQSDVAAIAGELRAEGLSLGRIADRLNAEGYPTRAGKRWSAGLVKRILDRARPA